MDDDLSVKDKQDFNEVYSYFIKVPKDRIAVIIGKKGETKKELESDTGCSISVDSKEGEIKITGSNSITLFALKEALKAIARGFNPDIARLLLKQDYALEIINLNDFNEHNNHHIRLKGRIIGRNGKARSMLEQLTGCYISVYGKTVSIIGNILDVAVAKKAVESLLMGSMHATVYKWLKKQNFSNHSIF